ncbi:MAG: cyclic nucleotide-binding domain-containing protein [Myxococcales bacterium]|nr:cyclic nucleotide-binding domain-containing protein [Myxococcales bacterium]
MTSVSAMPLRVQAAARSDVGRIRQNNEDSFLCEPELGLYVIADGMGGHAGGEIASAMAVRGLRRAIEKAPDRPFLENPSLENRRAMLQFLIGAVSEVNSAIFARGITDPALRGMGCTLDVLLIRGRSLFLAHVGDSRVYGLLGGVLYQMTEDHTLGQTLLNSGSVTAEEVAKHPQRNVLMRALGVYPKVEVDTAYLDIAADDVFLLCSDGVYGMVDPNMLDSALRKSSESAVQTLIQGALDGGGRDNATAIVVQVTSCAASPAIRVGSEEVRSAMAKASLFADFSHAELLRMQQMATGQVLDTDEVLIAAGQPLRHLFLVLDGRLSVWRDGVRMGWVGPGDPFGELSLHPGQSVATTRADQQSRVLMFPLDELQALMRSDPALGVKLAMNTLHRVWQRFLGLSEQVSRLKQEK